MPQADPTCVIHGPFHKICDAKVDFPTIKTDDRDGLICVQWKGKPDNDLPPNVEIPSGVQFLFPLLVNKDDAEFTAFPNDFLVPFLGKITDWPAKPATVQRMVDSVGEGNANAWIIWALNPSIGKKEGRIFSVCTKIVLLGDPNCGVIVPELFSDLSVRDKALALFNA